jgi:hypothetical protein
VLQNDGPEHRAAAMKRACLDNQIGSRLGHDLENDPGIRWRLVCHDSQEPILEDRIGNQGLHALVNF